MKLPFLLAFLVSATALFAQSPLAPLPPDGFVTLAQITSDFASQPDAAMQKYQGQSLIVYGRAGQVKHSDDMNGDPLTVYLQLAENSTPDVKCVFSTSDIPKGGQDAAVQIADDDREAVTAHRGRDGNIVWERPLIVEGRMVGIRGTFDHFVAGDIVMKDCRKVRPAKLREILRRNHIDE